MESQKHIDIVQAEIEGELSEIFTFATATHAIIVGDAKVRNFCSDDIDKQDVEKLEKKYGVPNTDLGSFGSLLIDSFYCHWFLGSFSKDTWWIRLALRPDQRTKAVSNDKTEKLLRKMAIWTFLSREYLPLHKQNHSKGERGNALEQYHRAKYMKDGKTELEEFLLTKIEGDWLWKTEDVPPKEL
ncbi:MAG: hypothetical protein Q9212_002874 [Teloschistes hypoglaucus]